MDKENYNDPDVEERWCETARQKVAEYLASEGVIHGRIGEWPAWQIAPRFGSASRDQGWGADRVVR